MEAKYPTSLEAMVEFCNVKSSDNIPEINLLQNNLEQALDKFFADPSPLGPPRA